MTEVLGINRNKSCQKCVSRILPPISWSTIDFRWRYQGFDLNNELEAHQCVFIFVPLQCCVLMDATLVVFNNNQQALEMPVRVKDIGNRTCVISYIIDHKPKPIISIFSGTPERTTRCSQADWLNQLPRSVH